MHIAFVVQGLFHKSDSVGYDCVHQYQSMQAAHPQCESVRLFAENFEKGNYKNVDIQGMEEFYRFCETQDNVLIIYHYCDGWIDLDRYITTTHHKVVIRWHNNTPPWFFIKDNVKSSESTVYGFEQIVHFISNPRISFWCNSEFSRRQLEALGAPADRIETVYPASRYLTKPPAGETPRRNGAFKDGVKLLFVSRVAAHKGHKHVLAVASLVQKTLGAPVSVEFPGRVVDKKFERRLIDLSRDLGISMKLYGEVSDEKLLHIYNGTDVFVCLSEHEGFGMPIFEAMRCGIPVVAWASTALEDLLEGHSLSFKNFNVKNFADAIVTLVDDGVRQRVLNEQKQILATYTEDVVSDQLRAAVASAVSKEDVAAGTPFDRDLLHEDYVFDSNRNLVSLYDIQNYRFFLQLLKRGQSWLPAMSAGEAGQRYGKGIRSRPGKSGYIAFGPFVSLSPGKYRLTAQLKMERGLRGIVGMLRPHLKPSVFCEVVSGERRLAQRHFPVSSMLRWPKVLEFTVETQLAGVEFRIWTKGKLNLRLRSVEVELVDQGPVRVG